MVKQVTENQYDDDLTVGTDDYDDSYYTGSVDLFEFTNDEESPISRLKSLILSIDWEITDEILMQFNEELLDLRDIWAGEKINLVYVQALEKISKYIYQKKADSHPSAIKLLLTLYHNLEKIVSSIDLTKEQKKEILLEDVKRFESLKRYIDKQPQTDDVSQTDQLKLQKPTENIGTENDLLALKALVLGIDWEITDQDLNELRLEVVRLEEKFAESRPRLVLLQGIGKLAAYIKQRKSNAHADAFTILHLFYECLEKIVTTPMTLEEEKAILFPAVERFNSFKILLGPTVVSEAVNRDEQEIDEGDSPGDPSAIAPAFADLPEEEIKGFQAEEEAEALGLDSSGNVDNQIESFFLGSSLQNSEDPTHVDGAGTAIAEYHELALQGVDVEEDEDEADTGVLSENDTLAPALSQAIEQNIEDEASPVFQGEELSQAEDPIVQADSPGLPVEEFSETLADGDFPNQDEDKAAHDFSKLDKEIVLQGVDVETEADDDSDEDALPMLEGELAPALAENDEVSIYNAKIFENSSEIETIDDEIAGTLGGFFDEEIESHLSVSPNIEDENFDVASVVVESENDDIKINSSIDSTPSFDPEQIPIENQAGDGDIDEDDSVALAVENTISSEEEPVKSLDDNLDSIIPETELEDEGEAIAFISELEEEKNLDLFFEDSDFEKSAEGYLAAKVEETSKEIDDHLDSFFDLGEDVEEHENDKLLFTLPDDTIEDNLTVEEDVRPSVSENLEEEEVVFELAEEESELSGEVSDIGKNKQTTSDELLSSDNDIFSSALTTEDENIDEFSVNLEVGKTAAAYDSLRICVDSLGVELDDKIIFGLWSEIDRLGQNLTDKPLEKTFLQLLSTITRHIDQNRYDSSTDAYVLLQSICRALIEVDEDDLHQNLELLLVETSNVLKWQENMLAEQIAIDEAELTIGDSILTDQVGEQEDFDQLVGRYEEDQAVKRNGSEQLSSIEDHGTALTEDTDILSDDMKQEITTLRQTLQDEIAELRNELKCDQP
ncbi:MAG: hypothetical protein GQ542_20675 [Desulforhopalus sp.]|nr:hypothetical protein [Desulforhopalus sp.]